MTGRSPEPGPRPDGFPPPIVLDPHRDSAPADLALSSTVVLLLAGAVDRGWAARTAVELSAAWARSGRRIVLADLHLEAPLLHQELGVQNLEGVVDIFLYGASVARIAQPVRGGAFYLIPAGTYAPDPSEIYGNPRWRKLVAGFRDTDAALVLFAPTESVDLGAIGQWTSTAVLLGPAADPGLADALKRSGIRVVEAIEPPPIAGDRPVPEGPSASDASPRSPFARPPEGGEADLLGAVPGGVAPPVGGMPARPSEPAAPPRHAPPRIDDSSWAPVEGPSAGGPDPARSAPRPRRPEPPFRGVEPDLELPPPPVRGRGRRRGGSVVLWLFLVLAVLAAAVYLVATLRPDLLPRRPGPQSSPTAGAAPAVTPEPTPASRLGELLPYSIQVRAFTSLAAAREELALEQRRLGAIPFFVSPEEIQGIVYFKILAGLTSDTLSALQLRDRLVQAGTLDSADAVGAWSLLQFTPLAFDLGEYASRDAAASRADSLLALQIPSYTAIIPYSDGTRRWQLYGGAFRDSLGAGSMRELLETAGFAPRITARTGLPAPAP